MITGSAESAPIAVVKVGGDILLDEAQVMGLADNVQYLLQEGWRVIILHGGGPQLSTMQARVGITPRKVAGRRVTSNDDLVLVKQVLCGQVNVDLVAALQARGVNAFGCHGASGRLIVADKRPPVAVSGDDSGPIDFGEVGDVSVVNSVLLRGLLGLSVVPVIASLGVGIDGRIFNINADTTVVEVARQLSAQLLIFVTSIGGIYKDIKDPKSRFSELTPASARYYIETGVIVDGMIPKVEEALSLLESGVQAIAISNAHDQRAFLSIAQGKNTFGTRLIQQNSQRM